MGQTNALDITTLISKKCEWHPGLSVALQSREFAVFFLIIVLIVGDLTHLPTKRVGAEGKPLRWVGGFAKLMLHSLGIGVVHTLFLLEMILALRSLRR